MSDEKATNVRTKFDVFVSMSATSEYGASMQLVAGDEMVVYVTTPDHQGIQFGLEREKFSAFCRAYLTMEGVR